MCPKRKVMAMGTQRKWVGTIVMLVALLVISAVPGYAGRGGHGFGGHGFSGHGFKGHGFSGHGFKGHGFSGHEFKGHGFSSHEFKGHGFSSHGFRGHGFKGSHQSGGAHVFIRPSIIVPFGAYWGPYWEPYDYPPVVVAPSPPVYAQPSAPIQPPSVYWYYCDASQAYYPYVQECPGGWRLVTPTPP